VVATVKFVSCGLDSFSLSSEAPQFVHPGAKQQMFKPKGVPQVYQIVGGENREPNSALHYNGENSAFFMSVSVLLDSVKQ
jgi:hypothetical protein